MPFKDLYFYSVCNMGTEVMVKLFHREICTVGKPVYFSDELTISFVVSAQLLCMFITH